MKNKFIEASFLRTLNFIRDFIFSEEYCAKVGLLQRLSPKIKLIALLVILSAISFARDIRLLIILYFFCLLLALLSRINLFYFLRRSWFFIPLFAIFIALPAIFYGGIPAAALFVLRVLDSVSFTILVVLTTGHMPFLEAMRGLGVPKLFITTFMMSYRYIFILVKITEDSYFAIKARLIAPLKERHARHIVAWLIASIWEKARVMSEEVYLAMLARGYKDR